MGGPYQPDPISIPAADTARISVFFFDGWYKSFGSYVYLMFIWTASCPAHCRPSIVISVQNSWVSSARPCDSAVYRFFLIVPLFFRLGKSPGDKANNANHLTHKTHTEN